MGAGLKGAYAGAAIIAGYTKIGTYTGDGNATQTIGLPFAADLVEVFQPDNGSRTFHGISGAAWGGFTLDIASGAPATVSKIADGITAVGATSFTVASGNGYNTLAATYYYRAQKSGVFP